MVVARPIRLRLGPRPETVHRSQAEGEIAMPIVRRITEFQDEMTAWRRDIHAHPELGFEENRTSDLVAAKLEEFGLEVHRGVGRTGVVGVLRAGLTQRS